MRLSAQFLAWLTIPMAASAIRLDVNDRNSIQDAARTIADGAMSYYKGNITGSSTMVGDLPDPYYWWQAGALWGAMLDYYHYTSDPTYNPVVLQALLDPTNTGPEHNFNPPEHYLELGNDDLAFWGFAVLSAAERNFPQPDPSLPSWLTMGQNIFSALSSRWNTTHCGGGVLWQVFASSPHGLNYKNSVTNGGLFQLAARLARATGRQDYVDWAVKAWDWSVARGLVGESFTVYDGVHASDNCRTVTYSAFTYTAGIYLHAAAVMAEHTGEQVWADRAAKLLDAIERYFFRQGEKNTGILHEPACEPVETCNHDMKSLKGYLSRFMWQSTHHLPSLRPKVIRLLSTSSQAAAQACSGGSDGVTCGQKWYVGGFDQSVGLGQQMCALETIQGLLIDDTAAPLRLGDIKTVREQKWPDRKPEGSSNPGSGDNSNDNEHGGGEEEAQDPNNTHPPPNEDESDDDASGEPKPYDSTIGLVTAMGAVSMREKDRRKYFKKEPRVVPNKRIQHLQPNKPVEPQDETTSSTEVVVPTTTSDTDADADADADADEWKPHEVGVDNLKNEEERKSGDEEIFDNDSSAPAAFAAAWSSSLIAWMTVLLAGLM